MGDMRDPHVEQLMSRPVETVSSEATIREAAAAMLAHDVGAVVVADDASRIDGLLTTTDVVRSVSDGLAPDATVAERMRTDVVTVERSASVSEVADAMLEHLIHHVPVVDESEVVGMLTTLDLTAYLARRLEP